MKWTEEEEDALVRKLAALRKTYSDISNYTPKYKFGGYRECYIK